MQRARRAFLFALPVILLLSACSKPLARQKELSENQLFAIGQKAAEAKKHARAIEAFQAFLERFPTSPLAPGAQFGLAMARTAHRDEVEAEVAFDDFLRLYPTDGNVPRALFEKGELLYRQAAAPGRDQTRTSDAIRSYARLLERAPNDPNAPRARERIRDLRNRLALHEEAVIAHYLARKKYESAEVRARRALAEYADTEAHPVLLSRLAEALEGANKTTEAREIRRIIGEKYPLSGAIRK